jgi:dUTP pyrophosphatase
MLKVYRISENATLPKFATQQSACFDISACGDTTIPAGHTMPISTGIILDIPVGYSVRIHPRSGLAYKKGITLLNAEGIIDSDYTNELMVLLYNTSNVDFVVRHGDRIAQGELVKSLDYTIDECYTKPTQKTDRVGGFGSTGI